VTSGSSSRLFIAKTEVLARVALDKRRCLVEKESVISNRRVNLLKGADELNKNIYIVYSYLT